MAIQQYDKDGIVHLRHQSVSSIRGSKNNLRRQWLIKGCIAIAITCFSGLQLKLLMNATSNSTHSLDSAGIFDPPAMLPKNATSLSNNASKNNAANEGLKPDISPFCPRCVWNTVKAGLRCDYRKAYLLEKEPNETRVDEVMRKDQPSCYMERITLEKQPQQKSVAAATTQQQQQQSHHNSINPQRGTSGKWINDGEYAKRNAFIDAVRFHSWGLTEGKKEKHTIETSLLRKATAWRWADDNAPVTEISHDGFCKVCHRLNITRLLVIGDSLSQDFTRSLEAHLGFTHPGKYRVKGLFEQLAFRTFEIPCEQSVGDEFTGVTIAFVKIHGLGETKSGVTTVTRGGTPEFVAGNPNNTAIVFNIGAHMKNLGEYKQGFDLLMNWIDSWSVDASKLYAFFRETIPGHPECEPRGNSESDTNMLDSAIANNPNFDLERQRLIRKAKFELLKADESEPYKGYQDYANTTQSKMQAQLQMENRTWKWFDFQHANGTFELYNEYSREVFGSREQRADLMHVHWLNVYNSSVLRKDGHIAFGDCLHYLQPGPISLWVHFFYSGLLDIAGLQHQTQ